MSDDAGRGCRGCGSTCGVLDCRVCAGDRLCVACKEKEEVDEELFPHPWRQPISAEAKDDEPIEGNIAKTICESTMLRLEHALDALQSAAFDASHLAVRVRIQHPSHDATIKDVDALRDEVLQTMNNVGILHRQYELEAGRL